MLDTAGLTLAALRGAYAAGSLAPSALARELHGRIEATQHVFLSRPGLEEVLGRCRWAAGLIAAEGMCWLAAAACRLGSARARPNVAATTARLPRVRGCPGAAGSWKRSRRGSAGRCGACPLL